MRTVTTEQLLKQCEALHEDLPLLMLYADTAEEQVEVDCNRTIEDMCSEDGSVPARITLAVLMLVAHWYKNREPESTVEVKEVPMTYRKLISGLRDYSKAYRR